MSARKKRGDSGSVKRFLLLWERRLFNTFRDRAWGSGEEVILKKGKLLEDREELGKELVF